MQANIKLPGHHNSFENKKTGREIMDLPLWNLNSFVMFNLLLCSRMVVLLSTTIKQKFISIPWKSGRDSIKTEELKGGRKSVPIVSRSFATPWQVL